MKTLNELYAIVLQQFHNRISISGRYDSIGICPTIDKCCRLDLISPFEADKVLFHFQKQRTSKHNYNRSHWWDPRNREVRIKFLESIIIKTKIK